MQEKKKGNRSESDLGNNMGNSLDAVLHSFHCLFTTRAMMKAEAIVGTCKNRMRRGKGKSEKKAFLLMNKGNFIFCLSLGMVRDTFYDNIRYFLLQFTTDRERERERERKKRITEQVTEAKRILFRCFSITIITSSIAYIRFGLGKHVFERVNARVEREKQS
jgi:hypothetical protein